MGKDKQFHAVDFHIHTPKSKCFKGKESGWIYNLLEKCLANKLKVIAITDHNTIDGYEEIIRERNSISDIVGRLDTQKSEYPGVNTYLQEVKQKEKLFNRILILPGVEYEAKPGVHLLFIFPPTIGVEVIRDFLVRGGYPESEQGIESPSLKKAWDALDAMKEADALGAIVIAAHVDNHKGIYELDGNSYRAEIFASDSLRAVSFNNPLTEKSIREMLRNKEYHRDRPMAYVQCSDYHGGEDERPGSKPTYILLSEITFEGIVEAFNNPDEAISATETPEIKSLIMRLLEMKNRVVISSLDKEEERITVLRSICAFSNTCAGSIIIGVKRDTLVGVNFDNIKMNELLGKLLHEISPLPICAVNTYRYGDRWIHSIRVEGSPMPYHIVENEKSAYLYHEDKVVVGTAYDLVKTAEKAWLNEFKVATERLRKERSELIERLYELDDEGGTFEQVFKLKQVSTPLIFTAIPRRVIDIRPLNYIETLKNQTEYSHGHPSGDVIYIEAQRPRLDNTQLRYSVPLYRSSSSSENGIHFISNKTIIVCPGGGAYIADPQAGKRIRLISVDRMRLGVAFNINRSLGCTLNEETLVAFLKSSLCLWYMLAVHGSADLSEPDIYRKLPIPVNTLCKIQNEITRIVSNITELESEFLANEESLIEVKKKAAGDEQEIVQRIQSSIDTHNSIVNDKAREIDEMIYKELDIPDSFKERINKAISKAGLYSLS